jgi:hypothetical protein
MTVEQLDCFRELRRLEARCVESQGPHYAAAHNRYKALCDALRALGRRPLPASG